MNNVSIIEFPSNLGLKEPAAGQLSGRCGHATEILLGGISGNV